MAEAPGRPDWVSGESGSVTGPRLTVRRTAADWALNAAAALTLTAPRLDRLATHQAPRRVLAIGVYRPGSQMPAAVARLRSERHAVELALGASGTPDPVLGAVTVAEQMKGGKFENLNRLLALAPPLEQFDWLLALDDDIVLGRRFLDRFVALCEHVALDLAQPAQTQRSHSAWRVTRRRAFSLARRTDYVEIGPLTAFSRRAALELTPFPELRFGWGLDNHWGALGRRHGWRLGIADALPVRHESRTIASGYGHAEAIAEGTEFLAGREYVPAAEAQRTLETVRTLR